MIFQYASDLHLEFSQNAKFLKANPMLVKGDILLLAGDISYIGDRSLNRNPFWNWAANNFRQTYIVPGNHEYYDGYELSDTLDHFTDYIRPNVSYRNNQSVLIDDTELFFTTLWSPVPVEKAWEIEIGIADCRRIKYNGRRFGAADYNQVHCRCMAYLAHALSESTAKKKIVVSHHIPTALCNQERFRNSPLNPAFVVELYDFIYDNDIDYWLFGHSHANIPLIEINGTNMLCNQLGYVHYGEHVPFRPDVYFEI